MSDFSAISQIAVLLIAIDALRNVYFNSAMFTSTRARLETEAELMTGFAWWWRSLLTCHYCLTLWIGIDCALVIWWLPDSIYTSFVRYAGIGLCAAHVVSTVRGDPRNPQLPLPTQPPEEVAEPWNPQPSEPTPSEPQP
jgi:hypothetical protein